MRLSQAFCRLDLGFDVARLREEISALPQSAWVSHPNGIAGNSAVRLISAGGGENDDVDGLMQPTPHLAQLPYVRQLLAGFGVPWSRSRLLRLAPGAGVPTHADINYHWFNRVRLHVPVITLPEVLFHCGGQTVHMAAGEAWLFDNWRPHSVENPTAFERIHLVADTAGSAAFWDFAARSGQPGAALARLAYDPVRNAQPLTERGQRAVILPAAEVEYLVHDLAASLVPRSGLTDGPGRLARYRALLAAFCQDWRQLHALHGDDEASWPHYAQLRDALRGPSRERGEGLVVDVNGVAAHKVLEGRVLRAAVATPLSRPRPAPALPPALAQPVFVIAAPRSGSTLLFETLAASHQLCTVGGEAHWLTESIPALRVGAAGVESNRLVASQCTDAIRAQLIEQIATRCVDAQGRPVMPAQGLRFLEKTPKNALRVPFFDRAFPDARYVFLWRDPRENLGSLIDAWQSGRWKTYNGLPGFDGPWSLLLPPGWAWLNGKPVAEIAAWQWDCTNRLALDDLESLAPGRFISVNYSALVADPAATIERIFAFLGLTPDAGILARVAAALPEARHTLASPDPQKWRRHEAQITPLLPRLQATWDRLQALATRR